MHFVLGSHRFTSEVNIGRSLFINLMEAETNENIAFA